MSDIDDIIDFVLQDKKLINSKSVKNKIYSDQPLIKRASQIKTPETPQKIKDMKAIAYSSEAYWKTSQWLFYTQGAFMADYTDVYEYTENFNNKFPTYSSLSNEKLRGFFSWRTRIRNGELPFAPIAFVYLLAFEIINNIGVKTPENGFDMLYRLYCEYGSNDIALRRQLSRWLLDYAVSNRLSPEKLKKLPDIQYDNAILSLIHCGESSDEDIFNAFLMLSAYPIEASRFYNSNGDLFREGTVKIFRSLSEFFLNHRKNSLCDKLLGHTAEDKYIMFDSAVYYNKNSITTEEYEVNEIHSYSCKFGIWQCKKYRSRSRNKKLGMLIKGMDCIMREKYNFPYKLTAVEIPKNTERIINNALDELEAEKRRKKAAKIEIDLSQLSSIRADADITRDKLLTEEDLECEYPEEEAAKPEIKTEIEASESINDKPLFEISENAFLTALLNGGDWSAAAREFGCLPSVLADSINEKLFDIFSDTVIDFCGDSPEIIEDYADELRALLKKGKL